MTDVFVEQLGGICRAQVTRAKWVLVPSHATGHAIGERLVREGTDWLNLRFVRPRDLALQMAAPFLVERGIDPSSEGLGPPVIMRLLLDLPAGPPGADRGYFRALADHPRMSEALWSTMAELRMSGLRGDDLPAEAFASSAKHAELRALLRAYEGYLADRGLADLSTVFEEAVARGDLCPVRAEDLVIELPAVIWQGLERRFIDALPGEHARLELAVPTGLDLPRRAARLAARTRPAAAAPVTDAGRLAFLMSPADGPPALGDGTLEMFRAGGREAEIEEVLRRVAAARVPLDRVEIACARPEHAALGWEKAQRYGLEATVSGGIPAVLTRPGRALVAFWEWIDADLAAGRLRRLLQSGDLRLDIPGGPSAGQAARLLARSEATWGRETYGVALAGLAASERARGARRDGGDEDAEAGARREERAEQAERFLAWLDDLLGLVPASPPPAPLSAWLEASIAFVRTRAAVASELDGAASARLVETLEELRAIGDLARPARESLALMGSAVDGLAVGGDRARPGCLHISSLAEAGYAGRPWTFVVGLEEGAVFPPLLEDPVLLDPERERISPDLATSVDRLSEAIYRAVSRLAALGGRVTLSYSCRDLRDGRETFPSWLMLQAIRVQRPERAWTFEDLAAALGEPVSRVPAGPALALSEAGWWLAGLRGAGEAGRPAVQAAFPDLARGERAEAARASSAFTAYDGLVPEAGPRLDPRRSGRPVSPTGLEDLARCPFRWFLRRGLGVEPVEEAEPDPDQWLGPMVRGGLLHGLYAAIMREIRQAGERPDPARHGPRLRELAEAEIERHRRLLPPPSPRVLDRERQELLDDLEMFLQREAEDARRTAVGFEVSFGRGDTESEPLARVDPVRLELGPDLSFLLRGSIDRIDRRADGTYEVVDYKTGRFYLPGGVDATFAGGRQLQHALYALVAARLLQAEDPRAVVAASSYYFPTARGRGQRIDRGPDGAASVAAVLRDLFDLLGAGAFVHSPDAGDCRYCELGRACGSAAPERAALKIGDAANAALDPYRRLSGHA